MSSMNVMNVTHQGDDTYRDPAKGQDGHLGGVERELLLAKRAGEGGRDQSGQVIDRENARHFVSREDILKGRPNCPSKSDELAM